MATTAATPYQQREKIQFQPNVPVTVTMRYPEGKIVTGRFGDQVMYSLEGNQVMFLDLAVAQKINLLEPQPGESVSICKRWNGQKGQMAAWDVWLSPDTEKMRAVKEQPDLQLQSQLRRSITQASEARYSGSPHGTLVVPQAPPATTGAGAMTHAPAPAQTAGHFNTPNPTPNRGLVEEANSLVDAFAEVLARALSKHEGRVKPEEVRSLLLSAYIQRGKAASHA